MGCGSSAVRAPAPVETEVETTGMRLFEEITSGHNINLAAGAMAAELNKRLSLPEVQSSIHGSVEGPNDRSGRHGSDVDFSVASTIQMSQSMSAGLGLGISSGTGIPIIDDMYNTHDVSVVLAKMRQKRYDAAVQEHGCRCLCRLSLTFEQREAMRREGAPQTVVQAMDRLRNQEGVQEHGCRAVRLISQDPAGRDQMALDGAIRVVLDALGAYGKNQVLVEHALISLQSLAEEPKHRDRIICGGGAAAVTQAIENHSDKPCVLELANTLLHEFETPDSDFERSISQGFIAPVPSLRAPLPSTVVSLPLKPLV
mmetsp:Transcript_501/g.858  ORF Transcript_501/g.858 Transcript_501/m.858 type:complete len:313 (+) Transcript_501:174-1112(+)